MSILSKVSQTGKISHKKNHKISLILGILKNNTNELTYKTEIDTDMENKLNIYQRRKSRGGMNYDVNNIHTRLYSTGSSTAYPVITYNGKEH